jgi:hypothetical protein
VGPGDAALKPWNFHCSMQGRARQGSDVTSVFGQMYEAVMRATARRLCWCWLLHTHAAGQQQRQDKHARQSWAHQQPSMVALMQSTYDSAVAGQPRARGGPFWLCCAVVGLVKPSSRAAGFVPRTSCMHMDTVSGLWVPPGARLVRPLKPSLKLRANRAPSPPQQSPDSASVTADSVQTRCKQQATRQ